MSDALHVVCPHCNTVNRVPSARLAMQPDCGKCGRPVFTGHPAELDAPGFEKQVGRSDIPVLVDFWAPWCGPCRAMAPAYEQAASQLEPAMRVVKLNTEEAQELAARHGIRSIPTLALFQNGREVARQAGAMDAGSIVAWARRHAAR
ncbi:thioredoxin TrxC [Noviherbaspirillum suwonense]|jgi:thioredoxin 2|uniref:Thioredoxin n=1 Tax=Noviherbaspirillum suwonense TaxID=1224511 RepID=A0ABY1PWZ3_9BURK|nr:thioredoxin TrxC [Noviherbaspirillum suwonense]SMP48535.1 thioredoxin [Noviherbaspirillum suwonense]